MTRNCPGIGKFAQCTIRKGFNDEEVLRKVLSVFPEAKTSKSCINWYRHQMRKRGENVPTSREINVALRAFRKSELESALLLQAASPEDFELGTSEANALTADVIGEILEENGAAADEATNWRRKFLMWANGTRFGDTPLPAIRTRKMSNAELKAELDRKAGILRPN